MDCTQYEGRLVAYLRGELTESDRLALEAHLAACSTCGLRLRELATVDGMLDRVRLDQDPGTAEERFRGLEPRLDLAGHPHPGGAEPARWVYTGRRFLLAAGMLLPFLAGIALGWFLAPRSREAASTTAAGLTAQPVVAAGPGLRAVDTGQQAQSGAALRELGYSLYRTGRYAKAQEALLAALRLEPDQPGPWTEASVALSTRGWAYYFEGRYDDAAVIFGQLLSLHELTQLSADPHDGLGWCYLRQGWRDAAWDQFLRAQAIYPDDPVASEGLAILASQ